MVKNITSQTFDAEIKNDGKPVVIDFYADWCSPCRMMGPVFEELSNELQNIKFLKVNTQQEQLLSMKFGVRSIPTLVVLKNGEEIDRITGFLPKAALRSKIQESLN